MPCYVALQSHSLDLVSSAAMDFTGFGLQDEPDNAGLPD